MLQLSLALYAPDLAAVCILAAGTYHFFGDNVRAFLLQLAPDTIDEKWREQLKGVHTALGPDHWRSVVEAHHDLGIHAHAVNFPEAEELGGIKAPVLIVNGDRDPVFPVEVPTSLYHLLSNAELCLLPNTSHWPPEEHPDWFNAIALDFLARHYLHPA